MKTIQNWQQFNEMKSDVYRNAAKKLRTMGHEQKAKRLEEHPKFLDKLKATEPYKDLPEFKFIGDFYGNFAGFDFGMSFDMWYDNRDGGMFGVTIPVFFDMKRANVSSKLSDMFSPFWINYYKSSTKGNPNYELNIEGPFNIEETVFYGKELNGVRLEEGSNPIYFDNRKDAMRLLKLLKDEIDTISERYPWFNEQSQEDKDEFLKLINRTLDKLNAKDLFR